jgi:hypothetical protein
MGRLILTVLLLCAAAFGGSFAAARVTGEEGDRLTPPSADSPPASVRPALALDAAPGLPALRERPRRRRERPAPDATPTTSAAPAPSAPAPAPKAPPEPPEPRPDAAPQGDGGQQGEPQPGPSEPEPPTFYDSG